MAEPSGVPAVGNRGNSGTDKTSCLSPNLLAAAALLAALSGLTVLGCFASPLLPFDDQALVASNPLLKPGASWTALFTRPPHAQYIPLTLLSLRLNYEIFGREAIWSFRAVNALLHLGSGLLLLALLLRLGLARLEALFIAALWTGHPMACESVAWVSERSNCLAACLGLAALFAYARGYGRWPGALGAAFLYLLALLAKPAALGFFPLFVALELLGGPEKMVTDTILDRQNGVCHHFPRALLSIAPLALLAAVFTALGLAWGQIAIMSPPGGHWYTALMTDTEILARYLFNIFCPLYLSAMYGVRDIASLADPRFWLFSLLLAALAAASLAAARSRRRALFGWLWFLGALAPNANLVAITYLMQDRYVYVASIGALLVGLEVVAGLRLRLRGASPHPRIPPRIVSFAGCAAVALFACLAASRSFLWDNSLSLFQHAVERQPHNAFARIHYAQALSIAAAQFRRPGPFFNLDLARANSEQAVRHFAAALECDDVYRYHDPYGVLVSLAREAVQTRDYRAAREALALGAPPPPPAGQAPPPERPEALMDNEFLMEWKGHAYRYQGMEVVRARFFLAQADIREFQDPATPPERAWACLARADAALSELARAHAPLSGLLAARVLVALGKFGDRQDVLSVPEFPDPDARLLQARRWLAEAEPCLYEYEFSAEVRAAFAPAAAPSPERFAALGRIALADAALRRAQAQPSLAADLAGGALQHALAAAQLDPAFPEALWMQAQVHLFLENRARQQGDPPAVSEHSRAARDLLGKIPEHSPRFRAAQSLLQR